MANARFCIDQSELELPLTYLPVVFIGNEREKNGSHRT